jgi:hypothetical protein
LEYEVDFWDHLIKSSNSCPVSFHKLSLIRRYVDDLFVADIPDSSHLDILDKDFIGGGICPRSYCEIRCT